MATTNEEKRKYLAGKMIDGAKALYDLFEHLKTDRELLKDEFVKNLIDKYELTDNQIDYLNNVAIRAKRAQGIIKYLENRFEIDENLNFQDSGGLHKLLFKSKYCPQDIKAKSYNIGIGLTRQKWKYRNSFGRAGIGFSYDQLSTSLEQTLDRLDKGRPTNCANLCFTLPTKEYLRKIFEKNRAKLNEETKFFLAIFNPSMEQEAKKEHSKIINHELRHVIDKILLRSYGYTETQAYMGADKSLEGLNIDLLKWNIDLRINDRLLKNQSPLRIIERLKNAPETISKKLKKEYEEILRLPENYTPSSNLLKELMPKIPTEDYRFLSYLFSTLPSPTANNSLSHLKLLDIYYGEKLVGDN